MATHEYSILKNKLYDYFKELVFRSQNNRK